MYKFSVFSNIVSELIVLYDECTNLLNIGGFALRRKDCRTVIGRRIQCSAQAPPPAWPGSAFPEPGRRTWDGPKPISIVGSTGSIGTQVWNIFFLIILFEIKDQI